MRGKEVCPTCGEELKLERRSMQYNWYYIYTCKKCNYERLLTAEERAEWRA